MEMLFSANLLVSTKEHKMGYTE